MGEQDKCEELDDVEQNPQEEPANPDDPPIDGRGSFDDPQETPSNEPSNEPTTTPKQDACPAWPPTGCELTKGDQVRSLKMV